MTNNCFTCRRAFQFQSVRQRAEEEESVRWVTRLAWERGVDWRGHRCQSENSFVKYRTWTHEPIVGHPPRALGRWRQF